MKVAVIGGGAWGGALSKVLADNENQVLIFDRTQEKVDEINNEHRLSILQADINETIRATASIEEAIDFADTIMIAVPTKAMRSVLGQVKELSKNPKDFICVSKGIEPGTHLRMSQVFEEVLGDKMESFVTLTGPSHAEEVIKGMVTCVVAASTNHEKAKKVQNMFNNNSYFRVYTSEDVVGCEVGGSLKNVVALASGFMHGLNQGDNGSAALITRAMLEIEKIGALMGAKKETLYGLTGLGDLIVTATSVHSRNFNAGYALARGEKMENLTSTVEGARTCQSAYEIIQKHNLNAPIFEATYEVLYKDKDVRLVIRDLLDRETKKE